MANRELTPSRQSRALQGAYERDPFASFRRQMDRLFDDFFTPGEPRSFAAAAQGVWPSLDIDETDQAYCVTAELPGMQEEDVEVSLVDNVLTIRGEKRNERTEEGRGRSYAERSYGQFSRSIPLAAEVEVDKAQANFKNGVLKIDLPKSSKAAEKTRRIEVKPG